MQLVPGPGQQGTLALEQSAVRSAHARRPHALLRQAVPDMLTACARAGETPVRRGNLRRLAPREAPPALQRIIDTCLDTDPERRPTAAQLLAQLAALEPAA